MLFQCVEDLLLCMVAMLDHIFAEGLIENRHIMKLRAGIVRVRRLGCEVKMLRHDAVLIEFGNLRLQNVEKTRARELTLIENEVFLHLLCDGTKNHDLTHIVHDRHFRKTKLFEDAIRKPVKGKHINIQDALSLVRRMRHDLLLCRKVLLLRHDQKPVLLKILRCICKKISMHIFCFPAACCPANKLK